MKERLLTRNLALCALCSLFYTMMFFLFFTGISSYSQSFFGTSPAVAGMVVSSFVVGDLAARIYFGRRMNLIGKRRLAVIALSVCVFVSASYIVIESLILFVAIRVAQGFIYGAASSSVTTLVTEGLPQSRRGEGIGYFMLSVSLGSAAGPFLCMWLQNHVSYDAVFAAGTVFTILALLSVLGVKDTRTEYTEEEKRELRSLRPSNYIEVTALPVALVCFVLFLSYSGVLSFMDPYGEEIGLQDAASVFFVFISITTLFSRMFLCRISDTKGDNVAVIPFFVLFIIGMFMVANAHSSFVLLTAGFLMGFNIAQYVAVAQAAAVRRTTKDRYGVAISTFSVFLDLSYAIGPVIHGYLIGEVGFRENYTIMAFVSILALLMFVFLHGIPEHRRRAVSR